MPETFEAILRGDRLEWVGPAPPPGEARVTVTLADAPPATPADLPPLRWTVPDPDGSGGFLTPEAAMLTREERGRQANAALDALRALHPDGWSEEFMREWHESRKDKPLSGREND